MFKWKRMILRGVTLMNFTVYLRGLKNKKYLEGKSNKFTKERWVKQKEKARLKYQQNRNLDQYILFHDGIGLWIGNIKLTRNAIRYTLESKNNLLLSNLLLLGLLNRFYKILKIKQLYILYHCLNFRLKICWKIKTFQH